MGCEGESLVRWRMIKDIIIHILPGRGAGRSRTGSIPAWAVGLGGGRKRRLET